MHDELMPEWLTNPESWGCRKRRYAAPILGGWVGRAQKIKKAAAIPHFSASMSVLRWHWYGRLWHSPRWAEKAALILMV